MYKSYCVTIRPKNGLDDKLLLALIKKTKKYDFGFVCTEKEGEAKHAHIQIWLEHACAKGTISTAFQRIQAKVDPDWNDAANRVMKSGVKIAYSDWYLDYCEMNDNKVDEEASNIEYYNPPPNTLDYYASEEDQNKILLKAKSSNKLFYELREKFEASDFKQRWYKDQLRIGEFVCHLMYIKDELPIIKDPKQMRYFIKALTKYINKDGSAQEFMSEEEIKINDMKEKYNIEQMKVNKNTK